MDSSRRVVECSANKSQKHKVLIPLPNTNDRAEGNKLDRGKYEVHFLHASDDVKDEVLTSFDYDKYLAQPGFLTSYVDRAVEYIQENGITAILFAHDLSSIVASVVCERTGLPGSFIRVHLPMSTQILLEEDGRRKAMGRLHSPRRPCGKLEG